MADIPEEKQDEYSAVYLAELEDDQHWEELFDRTTDDQWETMIAEAVEEAERGEGVPLTEVPNIRQPRSVGDRFSSMSRPACTKRFPLR